MVFCTGKARPCSLVYAAGLDSILFLFPTFPQGATNVCLLFDLAAMPTSCCASPVGTTLNQFPSKFSLVLVSVKGADLVAKVVVWNKGLSAVFRR